MIHDNEEYREAEGLKEELVERKTTNREIYEEHEIIEKEHDDIGHEDKKLERDHDKVKIKP